MKDLIKALQIFLKYKNDKYPTSCEHDVLYVVGVDYDDVSQDDKMELYKLGFYWDCGSWCSSRFGST